jgi:CubicO group peptidase (beta-lactamase class C family)
LLDFTEGWREQQAIPGVAIAVWDGSEHAAGLGVRAKDGCEPITPDTLFLDNTGAWHALELAALVAVEEGAVALDAPITDVAPTVPIATGPHGGASDMTLRHLLRHTAGITDGHFGDDNRPCISADSLAQYVAELAPAPLQSPPGAHWSYSALGSTLAGHILERATGETLAPFVESAVFAPLGMGATYDWSAASARELATPHPAGDPLICAAEHAIDGLYLSIRDRLRLLREIGAPTVVSDTTWASMYETEAGKGAETLDSSFPGELNLTLADGTLVGIHVTGSGGYQGCGITVPDRDFAVAVLWNLHAELRLAPCEEALALYTGITLPAYDHATDSTTWSEYEGTYVDPIGVGDGPRQIDVVLEGGELHAFGSSSGSTASYNLLPASVFYFMSDSGLSDATDRDVFDLSGSAYVRFHRDAVGVPVALGGTGFTSIGPHFFRQ